VKIVKSHSWLWNPIMRDLFSVLYFPIQSGKVLSVILSYFNLLLVPATVGIWEREREIKWESWSGPGNGCWVVTEGRDHLSSYGRMSWITETQAGSSRWWHAQSRENPPEISVQLVVQDLGFPPCPTQKLMLSVIFLLILFILTKSRTFHTSWCWVFLPLWDIFRKTAVGGKTHLLWLQDGKRGWIIGRVIGKRPNRFETTSKFSPTFY
jgi:hypothetical protein